MMPRNGHFRREARLSGHTIDPSRERLGNKRRRSNRPGNSQAKGPRRRWTSGKRDRESALHRRGNPRKRGNLSGPM